MIRCSEGCHPNPLTRRPGDVAVEVGVVGARGEIGVLDLAGGDGRLVAVAGPDRRVIGERVEPSLNRFDLLQQVRVRLSASGPAGEERVADEGVLAPEVGRARGRVSGVVDDIEGDAADLDAAAVFDGGVDEALVEP